MHLGGERRKKKKRIQDLWERAGNCHVSLLLPKSRLPLLGDGVEGFNSLSIRLAYIIKEAGRMYAVRPTATPRREANVPY